MKIMFMGTPDYSVFPLKALIEAGHEIAAVITREDKPKGRGYTLTPPPVKVFALEKGLNVYQPQTLRDEAFANLLEDISPELIVVVAYGKILPKNVLDFPKYGCINIHASLLPEYRGAAPIQRAIIDGKSETGVTTMYMAEGLDTGDMLEAKRIAITENDNFETIHDKLAEAGAELIVSTVAKVANGTITAVPQDDSLSTYAAKIEKSDCLIDFNRPAEKVSALIRGLSPIPLAFAYLNGKMLKIASATSRSAPSSEPGTVINLDNGIITVACADGTAIDISSVLPEGRSRMNSADFIRGRKISVGDKLTRDKTI